MGGCFYAVSATFRDPGVADEYVAWLTGGHIAAVLAGGARSARIIRIEADASAGVPVELQVEVQYVFESRERFQRYVAEVAPRLRQEGLERFGPARGVAFSRRSGEVVFVAGT
jgi:hypothetical protein